LIVITAFGALVAPPVAEAQPAAKGWRIGYLTPAEVPRATLIDALRGPPASRSSVRRTHGDTPGRLAGVGVNLIRSARLRISPMTDLPPEMFQHYAEGREAGRLGQGHGQLELARTQELLATYLAPPPAVVLDVGGGPGAYAAWLAGQGYEVHLVAARAVEAEPSLLGLSAHHLVVARRR
jgi:hypothetical protein